MANNTIKKEEIDKFSRMSEEWWDPDGKFKPLHKFNPIRIEYIKNNVIKEFKIKKKTKPFSNLEILDIGCGGGLLTEPMHRLGGKLTGIDASGKNINIAKIHAKKKGLKVGSSKIYVIHKESDSYKRYFKKQILMGSWYKYFLQKHPNHGRKMKIHILYKSLPLFKFCLPILKLIGKFLETFIKKNYPFKNINFFIYELYFKYANILGMLSESIKYD